MHAQVWVLRSIHCVLCSKGIAEYVHTLYDWAKYMYIHVQVVMDTVHFVNAYLIHVHT